MYCGNCGRKTSDTLRYCEHCNFDLIHLQKLLNEPDEEDEDPEDEFRSAADVAGRCLVLCAVVAASHGDDRPQLVSWLKDEGLWKAVSPKERSFFQSRKPTNKQIVDASWKVEALQLLLWALQLVPTLKDDDARADPAQLQALLPYLAPTSEFVDHSQLRSEEEIREINEKIYDAHWAIRDAEIQGKAAPDGLDPGVILERHRAINWLMGYGAASWDDVRTDT